MSVDLIKIDVEGHENSVLRGMRETLRRMRPRIVMFEYLARTDFQETSHIFAEVGYGIYFLDKNNVLRPVMGPSRPLQNLFAIPIAKLQ